MKKFLIAVGLFLPQIVMAKSIFYGSERETITLSHGSETLFRFDDEVKTITQVEYFEIKPADSENPDYRILSVKPRKRSARSNVTFILANDNIVNLKLVTVTSKLHESTNTLYDFKAKHKQLDPSFGKQKGEQLSEVQLMKAMIRRDCVVGYKVRVLSQNVRTGIQGVSAKLVTVYTGPKFHGYVFKIKNQQKEQGVAIDIKSLLFGRPSVALLSQVDNSVLGWGYNDSETLLRIVTKPTSTYRAVTLPVSPIIKK